MPQAKQHRPVSVLCHSCADPNQHSKAQNMPLRATTCQQRQRCSWHSTYVHTQKVACNGDLQHQRLPWKVFALDNCIRASVSIAAAAAAASNMETTVPQTSSLIDTHMPQAWLPKWHLQPLDCRLNVCGKDQASAWLAMLHTLCQVMALLAAVLKDTACVLHQHTTTCYNMHASNKGCTSSKHT